MTDYINTREAAQILGINPQTLYKWRRQRVSGKGESVGPEFIRRGYGTYLYDRAVIEKFGRDFNFIMDKR